MTSGQNHRVAEPRGGQPPTSSMPMLTPHDYDVNDPLGIHRALDLLPEQQWDAFFDDWVAVTEQGDFEVSRISSLVLKLTRERIRRDGAEDPLSVAWQTVSRSLIRYLAATGALPAPNSAGWLPTRAH